jgi:hypothetical protein
MTINKLTTLALFLASTCALAADRKPVPVPSVTDQNDLQVAARRPVL